MVLAVPITPQVPAVVAKLRALPSLERIRVLSHLANADDATRVAKLGYQLALVGTTLMNSPEPRRLVGELLSAGRAAALATRTQTVELFASDLPTK